MLRQPSVSGYFYPSDTQELRSLLRDLDGEVTVTGKCNDPIGVIVPHAGLVYSGLTAMHGYKGLSVSGKRKFVIVGPNHNSYPHYSAVFPEGEWQTPLGRVRIDGNNTRKLIASYDGLVVDSGAHSREHSVEVQIPFLQHLFGVDIEISCIVMGDQSEREAREVAKSVHTSLGDSILVSSTDLTHYEPDSQARTKDNMLIEAVKSLDVHRLYQTISAERITACGFGPIAVMMEVTRMSGGTLELLDYSTSGDTSGDTSSVVGYASFISCRD